MFVNYIGILHHHLTQGSQLGIIDIWGQVIVMRAALCIRGCSTPSLTPAH